LKCGGGVDPLRVDAPTIFVCGLEDRAL